VTSTADIIACAVSVSSHSAAARSACQISDLPVKAGAVSQNSSRLDSSCPLVIGRSELHTGTFRQICLFPGPGATVAQPHTHTTHTYATKKRQQDAGAGRGMQAQSKAAVVSVAAHTQEIMAVQEHSMCLGDRPSVAPLCGRLARWPARSPEATPPAAVSTASSFTVGLKQHAPMSSRPIVS